MSITSTTIEFHRFGSEASSLQKGGTYIRTCGYQKAAEEIDVRIEPRDLRRSLNRLRYGPTSTPETIAFAKQVLAAEASYFLTQHVAAAAQCDGLHQIDIVTHASELRAYPFEALYASEGTTALASPDQGVVLTRRIRADFSEAVAPWPDVPSILFIHAEITHDLRRDLVKQHRQALADALAPWGDPDALESKGLLVVREVNSVAALIEARASGRFSYIHVLAHGARVTEEGLEDDDVEWGLRLGALGSTAASPEEVVNALRPLDDYPLVVTMAACDSGNAGANELGNASLAERLHRCGIPVVIASQFPLTMPGSVRLARAFYEKLLKGQDVRLALHAARVALREAAKVGDEREHDWLSVVGYVRLPSERYDEYLRHFRLRVLLRLLEAARSDAEPLLSKDAHPAREAFERIGGRLREQIDELTAHQAELNDEHSRALRAECVGLLASANKSLAEILAVQAQCHIGDGALMAQSRAALEEALRWYGEAFRQDIAQHWHGMQKLSLEMALNGKLLDPLDLMIVRRVAQTAVDRDPGEYWACGTLAEALLLEAATKGHEELTGASDVLAKLQERATKNAKDKGFAKLSTRRQLERYVKWWTKTNGYFGDRETDLSSLASQLLKLL